MTKEKKAYYLKHKGLRCPYCESRNLRTSETDTQDEAIYRNVKCADCLQEWTDEYTLTGVTGMDE